MKRIVAMSTAACLVVAGCADLHQPNVNLKGADQAASLILTPAPSSSMVLFKSFAQA